MRDPSALYSAAAVILIGALVVRRTLRPQTMRLSSLVGVPIVLAILAIFVVAATPPNSALGIAIVGVGALAGAAVGYARNLHSKVSLGAKPGMIVVQGNAALVAILCAALVVRFVARAVFAGHGTLGVALTDAFVVFAMSMLAVARGLLFRTWRRLNAAGVAPSGAS